MLWFEVRLSLWNLPEVWEENLMWGIFIVLKKIFELVIRYKGLVPSGFVGVFTLAIFFSNIKEMGLASAFRELAVQLLSAEVIINEKVNLAIALDPTYTFIDFLMVINAVLIVYYFVKWTGKALIGLTGSQARFMAYVVAVVIMAIVEMSVIAFVLKEWTFSSFFKGESFIPLWDGVVYLTFNIKSVLWNINWFGVLR